MSLDKPVKHYKLTSLLSTNSKGILVITLYYKTRRLKCIGISAIELLMLLLRHDCFQHFVEGYFMLKLTFVGTLASSITSVYNSIILLNYGALQGFLF